MPKSIVPLLILCFALQLSWSQNKVHVDTILVSTIGQEQGLKQLNVKAIQQDDLSYLWLATEDGLHRFNGYGNRVYFNNPLDSLSIPEDHARDLLYVNDTLYIASNSKGVFGLKLSENKFFELSNDSEFKKAKTSYKLFALNSTYLLFSTREATMLWNRKTKDIQSFTLPKTQVENYVKSVLPMSKSKVLLATTASGILELNLQTLQTKHVTTLDNSEHRAITKFNNAILVGTKQGLYTLNSDVSVTPLLNNVSVNCFYKKTKQALWIGTDTGLIVYNTATNTFTKKQFLDFNAQLHDPVAVNTIKGDRYGNVWFGLEAAGVYHYNDFKTKFKTLKLRIPGVNKTKGVSSFQFLPYQDSTLFIGTTYGILKYNFLNQKFKHYNTAKAELIYTLTKDFNGDIWAGGFTTGLLKYNAIIDSFSKVKGAKAALTDDDVIQITPIAQDTLMVATWSGGLYTYTISENNFQPYTVNGKQLDRARCAFVDSKDNLWLGADDGAYKIAKNKTVMHYTAAEGQLSSDRIFAINEDHKGRIWLGSDVGLTQLPPEGKSVFYYKQTGLPNDFIYSVLIDDADKVWVSTNYGLSVLDPATKTFTNYLDSDGLQNNEFNGKAAYKDAFGNLYFGGIAGVNIFNPKHLKVNTASPKVHIESVELFNTPLASNELYKNHLEFKSDENVLSFNFAALNYVNPEKVSYAYKMEGFDADWRPATKAQTTTYTNLNPGNYTFKVKATNDSGVWSEHSDSMTLTIIPPWYKTNLFKLLAVLSIFLAGVLIYYFKTVSLRRDKLKLEAVVAERTTEIKTQNEALAEAYKTAEFQKNNIQFLMRELQHRVKNNLQIVSSLLNIQSNHLNETQSIEAIKVAKNRILAIANIEDKIKTHADTVQLDVFTKDISENIINVLSDDQQLHFSVHFNLQSIEVKQLNTTIYGLILNELITNTTKYAFDGYDDKNTLNITLSKQDNTLTLIVSDNGKGYTEADVSPNSLGVDLVKDMVSQLKGEITINTAHGTENKITIPL